MEKITEQEYKQMINEKAEKVQTKEDLDCLIDEIENFGHDYGTIVYGCMAAVIGAFNVVNRSPSGGITGFQASCLGWECVHRFIGIKSPAKIMDYNTMLYPQYADKFDKTISMSTWIHLKDEAKRLLAENTTAHHLVIDHWNRIIAGHIPFGYSLKPDEEG